MTGIQTHLQRTGRAVHAARRTADRRRRSATAPASGGAGALGALAVGAVSVGAGAVFALAIRRLAIHRAVIRDLDIRTLRVGRLEVEELVGPPMPGGWAVLGDGGTVTHQSPGEAPERGR